jgi:hypothetical protein
MGLRLLRFARNDGQGERSERGFQVSFLIFLFSFFAFRYSVCFVSLPRQRLGTLNSFVLWPSQVTLCRGPEGKIFSSYFG